jgi:histidinol-phosphatase (PHP family)
MPCDYHLHTPLCHHAVGWPIDYARRAVELGFEEIGISDHSPMPERFDDWRMAIEDLPRYLESVDEARAAFPQVKIRLGLEVDFLPGHEAWIEKLATLAPWDYFIGSVHYIAPGWDVDNPRWIGRFSDRPVEEIWSLYTAAYEQCIRSGLFDFVAHPDLVKKFGFRPTGDLRPYYEPVVAALADTGTPFEINTAGLRKECRELYPAQEFLEMAHAAGVRLLINSDAHGPEELGMGFSEAQAAAQAAGYEETVRFAGREAVVTRLDDST